MDIDKELNNILGKRDEYKDVVEESDTPSYFDSIVDSKQMNQFIESELESIENSDDRSPEDVVNMEPHDRVAMNEKIETLYEEIRDLDINLSEIKQYKDFTHDDFMSEAEHIVAEYIDEEAGILHEDSTFYLNDDLLQDTLDQKREEYLKEQMSLIEDKKKNLEQLPLLEEQINNKISELSELKAELNSSTDMMSTVETDIQSVGIHDMFDDVVAESQPKNETDVWEMPYELDRPDTQISRFNDGLVDESKPKMDFGPTWEERHEAYKQSLKESDIINRGATDLILEDEGPEL